MGNSPMPSDLLFGLALTLAGVLCSCLAGVYTETLFKGDSTFDFWQRNLQIGLYSVAIGLGGLVTTGQWSLVVENGFFHGFTEITVISILMQSLRGLVVAVVIKYTD